MSRNYEPEFKKIVRLHLEEADPSKVLLQNTIYLKQAFLFGQNNFVKNARQTRKPKPSMII